MAETLSSTLAVESVDLSKHDPVAWDQLAMQCGGSMRFAHSHLRHLNVRLLGKGRAQSFILTATTEGETKPIGCFAMVSNGKTRKFYDNLALLPHYAEHWGEAMQAILAHFGPGDYEWGWEWSLEPPRQADLAAIAGVRVLDVEAIMVHAVDFSQWPTWNDYWRAISENSRRNAQKAERANDGLKIVVRTGLSAIRSAGPLTRLRSAMYSRKGLGFRSLRTFVGYVAGVLLCPDQAMTASAEAGGRVLAAYHGVEFGANTYYLDGAAAEGADGGSWFLLLTMVRRAYERAPKGRFLMGYIGSALTREVPEGLIRSRRSLRVTEWPTSLIRFSWGPTASVAQPASVTRAPSVAAGPALSVRSDAA